MTSTGDQRRGAPRVPIELDVTLSRHHGNAVVARTVDLCATGMRVASQRPLHVDELMRFELALAPALQVAGVARVVRGHALKTYALRVESINEASARRFAQFMAAALAVIP